MQSSYSDPGSASQHSLVQKLLRKNCVFVCPPQHFALRHRDLFQRHLFFSINVRPKALKQPVVRRLIFSLLPLLSYFSPSYSSLRKKQSLFGGIAGNLGKRMHL